MPIMEEIHTALDTPGTSSMLCWSWWVYSAGIPSTTSMEVAAISKGSSSSRSPWTEGRSSGR